MSSSWWCHSYQLFFISFLVSLFAISAISTAINFLFLSHDDDGDCRSQKDFLLLFLSPCCCASKSDCKMSVGLVANNTMFWHHQGVISFKNIINLINTLICNSTNYVVRMNILYLIFIRGFTSDEAVANARESQHSLRPLAIVTIVTIVIINVSNVVVMHSRNPHHYYCDFLLFHFEGSSWIFSCETFIQ